MTAEPEFRWTQDDWGGESGRAGPSPLREFMARHGWLVRGAIVLLALLLFELTANAAVATAASCLEFGRTDFATALWLRRTDPDRRRGWITALGYLAWAFCLVGTTAFFLAMFIIPMTMWLANGGQPIQPPPHMIGALLMMLFAFSGGAGVSFVVCLAALITGRKVWLGLEPKQARREGVWPPSLATPRVASVNLARALFHLAWIFVFVPVFMVVVFASFAQPNNPKLGLLFGTLGLSALGIVATLILLDKRILARTPTDCWPLDEFPTIGPFSAN